MPTLNEHQRRRRLVSHTASLWKKSWTTPSPAVGRLCKRLQSATCFQLLPLREASIHGPRVCSRESRWLQFAPRLSQYLVQVFIGSIHCFDSLLRFMESVHWFDSLPLWILNPILLLWGFFLPLPLSHKTFFFWKMFDSGLLLRFRPGWPPWLTALAASRFVCFWSPHWSPWEP